MGYSSLRCVICDARAKKRSAEEKRPLRKENTSDSVLKNNIFTFEVYTDTSRTQETRESFLSVLVRYTKRNFYSSEREIKQMFYLNKLKLLFLLGCDGS